MIFWLVEGVAKAGDALRIYITPDSTSAPDVRAFVWAEWHRIDKVSVVCELDVPFTTRVVYDPFRLCSNLSWGKSRFTELDEARIKMFMANVHKPERG